MRQRTRLARKFASGPAFRHPSEGGGLRYETRSRIAGHSVLAIALTTLVMTALGLTEAVGTASAATLTVCPSGCAFSQIAPALAAASSGDTIQIAAGTYNGGFTVTKSINLLGAGAASTTISGGGPVLSIVPG